ncbi:hypothetical protein [Microcoleus vaginatus]|uniref:hypothetical protein n=1 Tax=Microcoleus vaginatus TaxID=119532 RepID=UPI001687E799|nr:hypothetical protein [Microcoleus sp. FACHB-84]
MNSNLATLATDARSHLPVILHKFDRPQQTEHNPITTGSSLKVPEIDYSKHKILLAVI